LAKSDTRGKVFSKNSERGKKGGGGSLWQKKKKGKNEILVIPWGRRFLEAISGAKRLQKEGLSMKGKRF